MSTLVLALISLGISAGIVLSSFAWWASFTGGPPNSTVGTESRGFPIHYYSVFSTYVNSSSVPTQTLVEFDTQTLAVDMIIIFVIGLGILTIWRWRALKNIGQRNRRRIST